MCCSRRKRRENLPKITPSAKTDDIMTSLLQSIPSPTKIRDELERMVLKDLLGPVGGPEEEIDEPSVRDRYLVGMLAPKRQELSPEEFDELPQGGSGPAEDGTAESHVPGQQDDVPLVVRDDLLRRPRHARPSRSPPAGATTTGTAARPSPRRAARRRSSGSGPSGRPSPSRSR